MTATVMTFIIRNFIYKMKYFVVSFRRQFMHRCMFSTPVRKGATPEFCLCLIVANGLNALFRFAKYFQKALLAYSYLNAINFKIVEIGVLPISWALRLKFNKISRRLL